MEILCKESDGQTLFSLKGRLDGNTAEDLLVQLRSCTSHNITLECGELDYVSSAGLRVILTGHKQCVARNGSFCLQNVGEMLDELLEMTGFAAFIKRL